MSKGIFATPETMKQLRAMSKDRKRNPGKLSPEWIASVLLARCIKDAHASGNWQLPNPADVVAETIMKGGAS